MTEILQELHSHQITNLLSRYGFELRGVSPQELLEQWQPLYPIKWIRLAVVEALYQGRYKVVSVEQILNLWLRRGQPTFHFNLEFERLICHNLINREIFPPLENPAEKPALFSNVEELLAQSAQGETSPHEQGSKASIDQFIPLLDASALYPKLKAVIERNGR